MSWLLGSGQAPNRRSLATPQISNRRRGRRRSCRRGHLVADNGLANGGKRKAGELQMLNPEWNPDDGDKAAEGPEHMPDRQPDSGEDEPYDIAKRAQRTGTDVVRLLEFLPTDGFLTEGEEGELTNDEARFAPRDADDGHERNTSQQPPRKAHQRPAQNEPQKIADCAHRSVPRVQTFRLPVVACEIRFLGLAPGRLLS